MKKVSIQVVDDLDGTFIEDGRGGTVAFSIEGRSYEVDLTAENLERLRSALAPFIMAGRPAGRRTRTAASTSSSSRSELQAMREWARNNGFKVSDRGRVSGAIRAAYVAAH